MIEYENLKRVNQKLFTEYEDSFRALLDSGWYILGKQVDSFEKEFASYCGVKHCVGVASGLDALTIAINAFEFPVGSEVIVASNTYIATIISILNNGLIPVLVEPDIQTYNIDTDKISEKITGKTCAIIAVHLYGKICDMTAIMSLAQAHSLVVIEDAAQAHGASHKDKKAGSFGIGCFSFYPTKNLGALGDAGAILSHNKEYSDKIKWLRNYGSQEKYYNDYLGFNSRLDEIQAGFLSKKLKILDEINAHKRALAQVYFENLSDKYIKPVLEKDNFDVYHIFNIRHEYRDSLKLYLLNQDIQTEIHYPVPPHEQKFVKNITKQDYPISSLIHQTTLSLPISFFHTESDVLKVCEAMNKWKKI